MQMARTVCAAHLLLLVLLVIPLALISANLAEHVPANNDLSNSWPFPSDTSVTSLPGLSLLTSPDYRSTDDTYIEEYHDAENSLDVDKYIQLPLPREMEHQKPARKSHSVPLMCAQYDYSNSGKPQPWKKRGGDWKMRGKHKNKQPWRKRMIDEHILCDNSCFVLWEVDSLKPSAAKIKKSGCSNWNCKPDCHQNMTVFNADQLDFTCCCSTENCNAPEVFLPSTSAALEAQGVAAADNGRPKEEDSRKKEIKTPSSIPIQGTGTICALKDNKKQHRHFDEEDIDSKLPGYSNGRFHVAKRYHPPRDEVQTGGLAGSRWPGGPESETLGYVVSDDTVLCLEGNVCFTLWSPDPDNTSQVHVRLQGCWLKEPMCETEACEATQAPRQDKTRFCCCEGHNCNAFVKDVYDPSKQHHLVTTSTSAPMSKAVGPIHDHSYREKTMIILLVLLPSLSLVCVLSYLVYRLCLTSKQATPPNSAAGTRLDAEQVDNSYGLAPKPTLDLNDLKILDLIVRGRYSEVRRGVLDGKDVAVKIYQQHHRQFFFNERSAFTLPFMDNENLVKFYGTAEKTMESSGEESHTSDLSLGGGGGFCVSQYLVVTELAPLGSLTGYLKNNTLDWYQLCHMCQGICAGLVHLHSDIKRPDLGLFKPAIAHRDINTRNILVKSDLSCVVADLGFAVGVMGSKIIRNGIPEVAEQCSLADVGTLRYMAPEVIDGAVNLRDCEASLKQIDVYALGLVIWELASRCVDLYQGAPMPDYQLPYQAEAGIHPLFEELQVLVVKYKTRPKFPDVWKDTHPAVRSLIETIQDCWDPDADARLTSLCVFERIVDMGTLWVQSSSKRKRDAMPTLNADLWPEVSRSPNTTTISGVVSNGVSVLPSYVEEELSSPGYINSEPERHTRDSGVSKIDADTVSAVRYQSAPNQSFPLKDKYHGEDTAVTALLIDSNLNKLTRRDTDESSNETKRVREWLQEQSMSDSTMETLLPLTPMSDRNQNLIDCDFEETFHSPSAPRTAIIPPPVMAVKVNNVLLAERKGVISHPNQGRNPTVERNTHKRSDEELAVEGNQLIGTLDSHSSGGSETLGPLAKRKGSVDNHNAPIAAQSYSGVMTDSADGGGEFSALVGHDHLNESHTQQSSRNAPIPFLQNQVHLPTSSQLQSHPVTMRPKLANLNIGANCNSYSHPVGERNRSRGRGPRMSFPQYKKSRPYAGENKEGNSDVKSVKNKLAKLIRPKDLGHKFSAMIFGGKKKAPGIGNSEDLQERSDSGYRSQEFQDGPTVLTHYDNSGLETSPQSKSSNSEMTLSASHSVPMQVELSNGVAVSSTCYNAPNVTANHGTSFLMGVFCSNRLINTDVRLGGFQDAHFKSPTLFAKSPPNKNEKFCSSSTKNDHLTNSQKNLITSTVPFQSKSTENELLLESDISQVVCQNPEALLEPMPDQNHNTETYSVTANSLPNARHIASLGANVLEMNIVSKHNACITNSDQNDEDIITSGHFKGLSSSKTNVKPNTLHYSQVDERSRAANTCPSRETKGENLLMSNKDLESGISPCKAVPFSKQPKLGIASKASETSKTNTGYSFADGSVIQQLFYNKLTEEVSQHQDTGKVKFRKYSKIFEQNQKQNARSHRPTKLTMCHSWHEDSLSEGSGFLNRGRRPKSLSLNGHNYEKMNSAVESNIHSSEFDDVQPTTPFISSSNTDLPQCQPLKTQIESFQPIQATKNQSSGQVKLQREKIKKTAQCALPSSNSCDHFAMGYSKLDKISDSKLNKTNKKSDDINDSSQNAIWIQKEARLNRVNCVSLDSSEKIRQRIKTPVSFKAGRLSLYDDRLMSQSLDSAILCGQGGEEV